VKYKVLVTTSPLAFAGRIDVQVLRFDTQAAALEAASIINAQKLRNYEQRALYLGGD